MADLSPDDIRRLRELLPVDSPEEPMRMDAYYYGFERTGVQAVDYVLSAVACAGKSYHHTDSWTDEYDDLIFAGRADKRSEARKIQDAAIVAAADFRAVAEERDRLRDAHTPRPLDDWGEDDGPVLWWTLPVIEPPYAGTPLDDDFPDYVTHWTCIVIPELP